MTNTSQKSTERRQEYEVHNLHSTYAGYCLPDTSLRSCLPDCDCTPGACCRSYFRLLLNLEMSEGKRQRRQSSDGIHVQEGRLEQDIRANGGNVDMLRDVQMVTSDRRYPDSSGISMLVSACEQLRSIDGIN